jgi:hypothetical protein
MYSGRRITDSLCNVTVRGEKRWKEQGGRAMANSLSMYSITENIYYSQLSSVAILLQPEPNCFTSYNTRKWLCFFFLCAIVLRSPPPSVSTCKGQRSSQLFCVYYRHVTVQMETRSSLLSLIDWTTGRSGFDHRQRKRIFSHSPEVIKLWGVPQGC